MLLIKLSNNARLIMIQIINIHYTYKYRYMNITLSALIDFSFSVDINTTKKHGHITYSNQFYIIMYP